MFSFLVGPDLDILFEKLTGQIGARPGLGIPLLFEVSSELRVSTVNTLQLALG